MLIKKKRNSLIEICLYILLIPIIIFLLSSMYLNVVRISRITRFNINNYTKTNQVIQLMNLDANSSYNFEIINDKLVLYTNKGIINYEYKDNYLYRNEYKYISINDFEITNITSDKNKQVLYEIKILIPENKFKGNGKADLEINTKISFPIKAGE